MKEEIRKLFPLEFYINDKEEIVSEISLKTLNKLSDEIIKLQQENENLQSQLKEKEEMVKVMEKYFELIIDLGFDYDGAKKSDSLKSLIDELVRFAKLGRACNTTETIYSDGKKYYNILNEEILSKGENK